MNLKVISVISDRDNEGYRQLTRSLNHHKYNHDALNHPFSFGGQMQHVYEYAKNNWGWFLYTDGWDTFALGGQDELEEKMNNTLLANHRMIISAEKNCYPHSEKALRYPKHPTEWKYVNAGGFITECVYFAELYDKYHQPDSNDQDWLTEMYLQHPDEITLDRECLIFQTIAFEGPEDFSRVLVPDRSSPWGDSIRLKNNKTGSLPIFIHANAHTPMGKVYNLL